MAGIILLPISGYALHSIKCLMTDQVFHSVGTSSCCCGTPREDESKKCCEEETTTIKVDRTLTQKELSSGIHPVFLLAFVVSILPFELHPHLDTHFLHYLKNAPPLPERDIIVFDQAFLI